MNESNLHTYQQHGVSHIMEHSHAGLFLDMGLGKTVTTLTAVNKLIYEELEISKVLIVAPKRVAEMVWSDECEKWEHLQHLRISKIIGTPKQREAALKVKADIYLISRDNVAWLCGKYGGGMVPFDMAVFDESSSFKSPKSVRFKAVKKVQPSFDRVLILTGTPSPNGLGDLWSQIYLLDRGERLGRTLGAYRERYFVPGRRNGHVVYNYDLRREGEAKIHNKIKDICLSMSAKNYLDMPDRVDNVIEVKMPADLAKRYEDFEREQILDLEEGEVSAVNAAALSNKLLQFANGALYDEDRNVHEVHDLKLDAIEEIIEEANGKPVLIAWTYKHDRQRLEARLKKYKPVNFQTTEHKNEWNAGRIRVMMMHPASGGHGLNLQKGGSSVVWFGQTWSLELYQQLNARLYRQGQEDSQVFIHHIATKGTLDIDVIKSLESKNETQSGLMEAIKARKKKYGKR